MKPAAASGRRQGAAIRARLVEAALDYVWDNGYGASTIARIAEHADVPRGSVFYYFPAKDDIVLAALESYVAQAHQRRLGDLLEPDGKNALVRFQAHFHYQREARRHTEFRRGCLLGNLAGEIGGQEVGPVALAVRGGLQLFEQDMLAFLEAASRAGQIRFAGDLSALAATLVNGWEGALLQMKLQRSAQPLDHFIASFSGLFGDAA